MNFVQPQMFTQTYCSILLGTRNLLLRLHQSRWSAWGNTESPQARREMTFEVCSACCCRSVGTTRSATVQSLQFANALLRDKLRAFAEDAAAGARRKQRFTCNIVSVRLGERHSNYDNDDNDAVQPKWSRARSLNSGAKPLEQCN